MLWQTDDLEALLAPAPASPRHDTRVRGTVLRCSKIKGLLWLYSGSIKTLLRLC
jgi:hypothetical protein